MADRYWVGGTGTWTTTTTNWSATSGGAGGASVPTAADNVFFDANSNTGTGAFTVTTGSSARPCLNLTISGLDGAMTLAGTLGVTVSGSMSLPATNLTWTNTGTLTFNSATGGNTITTNGVTIQSPVTFNNAAGTWVLQDAFTTTKAITLTAGTLNLNAKTLTGLSFTSSGSTARNIDSSVGTSYITVTGTGTVWNVSGTLIGGSGLYYVNVTNSSATATTITSTASSFALNTGPTGWPNFNISAGTYTLTLTTGSFLGSLNFTGYSGALSVPTGGTVTTFGDVTYSSTMTTVSSTGTFVFSATSATEVYTTNGVTVNHNLSMIGTGGTVQLGSNITQLSTRSFNYTSGTFDINSKTNSLGIFTITTGTHAITNGTVNVVSVTHTSGDLAIGTGYNLVCAGTYTFTAGSITINNGVSLNTSLFVSSNTNTRSIAFGTGSIIVNGTGTVWNVAGVTGMSYTGTSNVIVNNATATSTTITNASTGAAAAFNFYFVSGTYSLTMSLGNTYGTLDFTGFGGTWAAAGTTHTIRGNLVIPAFGGTFTSTAGTPTLTFASTSGVSTITTNGRTLNLGIIINGVGGTVRFADSFTQSETSLFRLDNGTVDVNSQTVTVGAFTIQTGTHAITNGTLNAPSVTHTSGDLSIGAGYNVVCTGTYTFTAGSITINDGVTLSVAAMSSVNTNTRAIAFGTGSITVTGSGAIWNVTGVSGLSYTGNPGILIDNNTSSACTITNTAIAASAFNFRFVSGSYALTLTSGNSYRNINFTSGFSGSWAAGTSTHNIYGNVIAFSSSATYTATAGTSTLTLNAVSGSTTTTINTNGATIGLGININTTGQTVQLLSTFTQDPTMSFTLTNGTLDVNSQTTSIGIFTIVSGTHAITNGTVNCASVTHTSGDLSIGTGYNVICAGTYTFTAGSITINNNVNLSVGTFVSTNTNSRSIAFGTGSITTKSTGTVWNVTGASGLSYTGTSNIIISNPTSTAVTVTNTASSTSMMSFSFPNGSYTLTLTSGNSYNDLNFTGFTGTVAFGTTLHTQYGNLTLGSGTITSATAGTATFTFNGASGASTKIITTNGAIVNFGIAIGDATIQLADSFTQGSTQVLNFNSAGSFRTNNQVTSVGAVSITTVVASTSLITGTYPLVCARVTQTNTLELTSTCRVVCSGIYTHSNGSLYLTGENLNVGSYTDGGSVSSRSIVFNTAGTKINVLGSGAVWNVTSATGFDYIGESAIYIQNNSTTASTLTHLTTASADRMNFYVTTGTYQLSITTGSQFNKLDFTGFTGELSLGTSSILLDGDLILYNGMTTSSTAGLVSMQGAAVNIKGDGVTVNFSVTYTASAGTLSLLSDLLLGTTKTFSLTTGTLNLANRVLNTGILDFSTGSTTSKTIDYSSGGYIVVTGTSGTVVTSTQSQFIGTSRIDVNSAATSGNTITVVLGGGTGVPYYNINVTSGSYNLVFSGTTSPRIGNLNFTGFSGNFNSGTTNIAFSGNITASTGMTIAGTGTFTFDSGSSNIISNGKTFTQPISISGGNITLLDAFTSTSTISHTTGNLLTSNYNLTAVSYTTVSGTKTLTLGSSVVTLTGSGAVWTVGTVASGFTFNYGTSTITLTSASAKTFSGNGNTYWNLNQGGAGALTIVGSNGFNNITNTVQPTSIIFTAGTNNAFNNFSLSGTTGNLVTIGSSTTSTYTLTKSSGIVTVSNCSISRSVATGGATWRAPTNYGNVDGGSNTGWIFTAISTGVAYFMAFFF